MAEQAKVPAIRFAGFTDPWEQRKLGDVTDSFSGGTPDGSHASYYGGSIPFIRSAEINSDKTELFLTEKGLDNSSAKIVERGTVLYALYGATSGEVGIAAIKGAINQAILALSPHTGNDPLFLASWLRREKARIVDTYLQGGQGNLSGSIVKELSFALPQQKEQQVIGSFFSHLDNLITLHQRKYDKLVVFKKSMLEKMFPKDGESVPEIRFAGFTDPWEQRKLGDVASSFDYGLNAAATEYDGQNKYLRITDIDDETHEFSKSGLTTPLADLAMSADYLLKEGDLLFARTGASVGKTYLYRQFDGMVYFAGFLIRARIGEGADPEFAYQATLTDAYKKYVAITSQRSGQPGVNAQEYADYQLMLPSKTEQQQIGMTLRSLDSLITLHQRKLELLQNIKKSLLDKMFV